MCTYQQKHLSQHSVSKRIDHSEIFSMPASVYCTTIFHCLMSGHKVVTSDCFSVCIIVAIVFLYSQYKANLINRFLIRPGKLGGLFESTSKISPSVSPNVKDQGIFSCFRWHADIPLVYYHGDIST